jgi:hypothetical protein
MRGAYRGPDICVWMDVGVDLLIGFFLVGRARAPRFAAPTFLSRWTWASIYRSDSFWWVGRARAPRFAAPTWVPGWT